MRPVVVVSHNEMNQFLNTVVVCPLTSALHPRWRSRLQILCAGRAAEIAVDQIRAISKQRLRRRHPLGDDPLSDAGSCESRTGCDVWIRDSEGDDEARNLWVQQIVKDDGWPLADDSAFVLDEHYSEQNASARLNRWWEVPTPYGDGSHGTTVASTAAGKNLGVAPEATIVPIAINLTDDQGATGLVDAVLRLVIAALPNEGRGLLDDDMATSVTDNYAKFDVINRSHGTGLFDPDVVASAIDSELAWYRQYLPKTLDAVFQINRPDAEKTILVYAAGNESEPWSTIGANLPYYIPEVRGHAVAVVATDPETGRIADYSNSCGPLPSDWNAVNDGPHYCLAAPGTVRGLVPDPSSPGLGTVGDGLQGTSYAAPVVSGALALLMEHFRGTQGSTAIVKRMLDTADRSGHFAELETYGAGHLDLEAALSPVGGLTAGQSARALQRTALATPTAFGPVAARLGAVELTAFDTQDFPFWVPLAGLVSAQATRRSPIPSVGETDTATPATGLDALGLHWAAIEPIGERFQPRATQWIAGFGPTSVSVARRPLEREWGYGLSFSEGDYLGTRASGAFGSRLHSGMLWASRSFERELSPRLAMNAMGTLAFGSPHYESNALFEASPSVMSAFAVRLGTENTGLMIEQPLRAESGTGTFRVENGWIQQGRRLYDEYRIPLRPDAREVRVTFRHERVAAGGRIALEIGGAMNAGHVQGMHQASMGLAYRTMW